LLTKEEAHALVLARLKSRCGSGELSIAEWGASERAFGWVFEVSLSGSEPSAPSAPASPRWVIVNKISHQVVASIMNYNVEEFVRHYEKLLAQNQALSEQWCGTPPKPWPRTLWRQRTVAERAKQGGFYEIGGKEDES
jgi:hypothetical protein